MERFIAKKYGLTAAEAKKAASHPDIESIIADVESWRDRHGCAASSPLARGYLLDKVRV